VFVQGISPSSSVNCESLPGLSVDVKGSHVSLTGVFESQMWAAGASPPSCQLSIEDVLRDATVLHAMNVAKPA